MYRIKVIRHFYGPNTTLSYLTDENGSEVHYDSKAEAQATIDEMEAEVYELAHNESSRPEYRVVQVK